MSKPPSLARLRLLNHILRHHFRPLSCTSSSTWRCLSTIGAINKGIRADRFQEQFSERKLKKRVAGAQERLENYKAREETPAMFKKKKEFPESMRRRGVALESKAAKWKARYDAAVAEGLQHNERSIGQVADISSEPAATPSWTTPSSKPKHDRSEGKLREENKNSSLSIGKSPTKGRVGVLGEDDDDGVPVSIPYTTAASVFLYGLNTVRAALLAGRRKIHAIHILRSRSRRPEIQEICDLAREREIRMNDNADLILLDRMSEDRPHNGVVLEGSKLSFPPIRSLEYPNRNAGTIAFNGDPQRPEDSAVNEPMSALPMVQPRSWRQPLIVMLDGILDPQNLGNILRTAHFYGVDAVAVATNTCANINSGVVAKASSGACEAVRLLALPRPSDFLYQCSRNGWKIWASVAPLSPGMRTTLQKKNKYRSTAEVRQRNPLATDPCILMLGSEGEGLPDVLLRRAHQFATINQAKRAGSAPDIGVDSINVGVAAGVLFEAFLREPRPK